MTGALYAAAVDRTSRAAVAAAAKAWTAAAALPPASREAYLLDTLMKISVVHGELSASVSTDYLREQLAGDAALATLDMAPTPADGEHLRSSLTWAMQTKTEGLVDPDRAAAARAYILGVVDKHVRRHGFRHLQRMARDLGKSTHVAPEVGACGFCLGRISQGAIPPYHAFCRCAVQLPLA